MYICSWRMTFIRFELSHVVVPTAVRCHCSGFFFLFRSNVIPPVIYVNHEIVSFFFKRKRRLCGKKRFLFAVNDDDDSSVISSKQQAKIHSHTHTLRQMSNEQGHCQLWSGFIASHTALLLSLLIAIPTLPTSPLLYVADVHIHQVAPMHAIHGGRYIFYDTLSNKHFRSNSTSFGVLARSTKIGNFDSVGKFRMVYLLCQSVSQHTFQRLSLSWVILTHINELHFGLLLFLRNCFDFTPQFSHFW